MCATFGSWKIDGITQTIEYSDTVLERIHADILDGFYRLNHGGIEVGGVLFGNRNENAVRILDFRTLPCEHALGPSFVLSERDESALERLLKEAVRDPELRDLEVVGYYQSRTRSHIHFSGRDLEIFNRYYPHPWQIAVMLRPAKFEATRIAIFCRTTDGTIKTTHAGSYESRVSLERSKPSQRYEPVAELSRASEQTAETEQRSRQVALTSTQHSRSTALSEPSGPIDRIAPQTITVSRVPRTLAIKERLQCALSQTSAVSRLPRTLIPAFRLRVRNFAPALPPELRNFPPVLLRHLQNHIPTVLGIAALAVSLLTVNLIQGHRSSNPPRRDLPLQPSSPAPMKLRTVKAETENTRPAAILEDATESTPARPDVQSEHRSRLRNNPEISRRREVPESADEIANRKLFVPPPEEAVAPAVLLPPEPAPPQGLADNLRSVSLPDSLAPLLKPTTISSGPPSGKLIWKGRFPRKGALEIARGRVSSGSLEGTLPGYPVDVSVYPGNLKAGVLTLYTADMKYSRKILETPDPRNDGNKILYTWEPLYARDVEVVEAPGAQNEWNKLVLRSRATQPSVIVIQWRLR